MKGTILYLAFWASIVALGALIGTIMAGEMNTYIYIGIIIVFAIALGVATRDEEENEENEQI